jgi:hypothetical protein
VDRGEPASIHANERQLVSCRHERKLTVSFSDSQVSSELVSTLWGLFSRNYCAMQLFVGPAIPINLFFLFTSGNKVYAEIEKSDSGGVMHRACFLRYLNCLQNYFTTFPSTYL